MNTEVTIYIPAEYLINKHEKSFHAEQKLTL